MQGAPSQGLLSSLGVTSFVAIGAIVTRVNAERLPVSIEGCNAPFNSSVWMSDAKHSYLSVCVMR